MHRKTVLMQLCMEDGACFFSLFLVLFSLLIPFEKATLTGSFHSKHIPKKGKKERKKKQKGERESRYSRAAVALIWMYAGIYSIQMF